MLDGNANTENSENYTYNTAGEDSANYEGEGENRKKSEWVKDGDTWTYTFYVDDPNAQWYVWEDTESLMENYTADFTENNVGTLFIEETLNAFEPMDYMKEGKDKNNKTIYTWLDNDNAYKVTVNGDGTFTKKTTKLSFQITNTKEGVQQPQETALDYGSLTISKIVKDSEGQVLTENEDSTNFQFTVTLTKGTADEKLIQGTKIFGNVVFKEGVAKVSLKAGKSITITDLPVGIKYTVAENDVTGYKKSFSSSTGNITKNVEKKVICTNTKLKTVTPDTPGTGGGSEEPDNPEQKYVDVTIKKSVIGNGEISEDYIIEVELNGLKQNKIYELSNGTTFKSNAYGEANVSIKLSNEQSIIIKNIPVGAKYKAFEYAGDYISSYIITDSNNKGMITSTSNRNTRTNTSIATLTETADEDENVTITFTNRKVVTENLKLIKKVTDENNDNSYTFDIEFGGMEPGSSFNSTVGKVVADPNGKAELTVYLANNEEVEFYNVPVGTTYMVKELASSSVASFMVEDSNGLNKIFKSSGANTKPRMPLSTEREIVNQGENVTVTFINNTVNEETDSIEVSLGVTKIVQNKSGEKIENCEEPFDFELIAINESNEQSSEKYPMPEKTNVRIVGNGTENFGNITFTEAGTYKYKIIEKTGNSEGYEYDNSEYIVTFDVINVEGLLELNQNIQKNGFKSDAIIFTNKYEKIEQPEEPTNPENPEEPTEPEKPDEPSNPEEPVNTEEPKEPTNPEQPKKEEPINQEQSTNSKNSEEPKKQDSIKPEIKNNDNETKQSVNTNKNSFISNFLPKTGNNNLIYFYIIIFILLVSACLITIRIFSKENDKKD